jgi:hypothetical protein
VGHYSDFYAAEEEANLIRAYGPETLPELTERNLKYNIARANKAEAELRELKKALRTLKSAVS